MRTWAIVSGRGLELTVEGVHERGFELKIAKALVEIKVSKLLSLLSDA